MSKLEARMAKIPDPFVLMYKPPGGKHQKINIALDDLYNRLNSIEVILNHYASGSEER